MRFLSLFKCKTKRNSKKKTRKTRKQVKRMMRRGGGKSHTYANDDCDALPVKSEANRFFKLKCYLSKANYDGFNAIVHKLIEEYRDLNDTALQRGTATKNTPFMNYIDKNYNTFSPVSKQAVAQIYTRFQEEALPIMKYIL